jgi:integrase
MPRAPKPYKYRGWYVTDAGGRKHHRLCLVAVGFGRAKDDLARLLAGDADAATSTPPAQGKPDYIGDLIRVYLTSRKGDVSQKTFDWYRERLKPLAEKLGPQPLQTITDADGRAYKAWVHKDRKWHRGKIEHVGVGPTTVNACLRVARQMFKWASAPSRNWMHRDPWSEIKALREPKRERLMTDAEFQGLLSLAGPTMKDRLILLRNTTLRPGEMLRLKWDEVDFNRKQIRLRAIDTKTGAYRVTTIVPEAEAMAVLRPKATTLHVDSVIPAPRLKPSMTLPAPGRTARTPEHQVLEQVPARPRLSTAREFRPAAASKAL